jgi:hypothetical protein
VLAPKGTPQAIIEKLNQEVNLAMIPLEHRFIQEGADPVGGTVRSLGAARQGGGPFEPQLHQQGPALEPRAPAGEVEGEIQALALLESPGQGIVAPGGEIGASIWKTLPEQGGYRSDCLGKLKGSGLLCGIHGFHLEGFGAHLQL